MGSTLFITINNIISLVALAYLALVLHGIVKAPTRESRERYEAFKETDGFRWVKIGVPVLFVIVLLLALFDKSI